ncbi:MAG: HEAT repeat domain-containing protein [Deltaproteobacteria bacterium]|nr:HEAT repeat domain-containing protein [Deltaproteobacteria bacterium]
MTGDDGHDLIFRGNEVELDEGDEELVLDAPAELPPAVASPKPDGPLTGPPTEPPTGPFAVVAPETAPAPPAAEPVRPRAVPPAEDEAEPPSTGEAWLDSGRHANVQIAEDSPLMAIDTGRYEAPPLPQSTAPIPQNTALYAAISPLISGYQENLPPLEKAPLAPNEVKTQPEVLLPPSPQRSHSAEWAEVTPPPHEDALDLALDLDAGDASVAGDVDAGTLYEGPAIDASALGGEQSPARVTAVQGVFSALDKAIRIFNLYEGRSESCTQALSNAHRQLKEVLVSFGEFSVRISPYEFLLEQEAVYTSDEERLGMTYRLFRDGVRELHFKRGATVEELGEFLEVLRIPARVQTEDDSVTMLWQKNLQGIGYRAVDVLVEGFVDADDSGEQGDFAALLAIALAEPSQPTSSTSPHQDVPLALAPEALATMVLHGDISERLDEPSDEVTMAEDIWRRAIWLASKMTALPDGQQSVVKLLAQLVDQLIDQERWSLLAGVSEDLAQIAHEGGEEGQGLVRAAVDAVCGGKGLRRLAPLLSVDETFDLSQLEVFFRLLPPEVNRELVGLLRHAASSPGRRALVKLLQARGADLTPFFVQQLSSAETAVVLGAMRALSASEAPGALAALRRAIGHEDWRVNVTAIEGLKGRLSGAQPALVKLLERDVPKLRLHVLAALETCNCIGPADAALCQIVASGAKDWPTEQRKRLHKLAVSWGGGECRDYAINALSAGNPLRRKRVEQRREEIFEAVQRVGGATAQSIFQACLNKRLSDGVRQAIERALERVE